MSHGYEKLIGLQTFVQLACYVVLNQTVAHDLAIYVNSS